jgi:hypothetical protein
VINLFRSSAQYQTQISGQTTQNASSLGLSCDTRLGTLENVLIPVAKMLKRDLVADSRGAQARTMWVGRYSRAEWVCGIEQGDTKVEIEVVWIL